MTPLAVLLLLLLNPAQDAMATPSTQEKHTETRRTIGLLAPAIAGPVASIWSNSLIRQNSMRSRRVSGDSEQHHSHTSVKFTLTKTGERTCRIITGQLLHRLRHPLHMI